MFRVALIDNFLNNRIKGENYANKKKTQKIIKIFFTSLILYNFNVYSIRNGEIEFVTKENDTCRLSPVKNREKLIEILTNQEIVRLTSITGERGTPASLERIDDIFAQFTRNYETHGLGFYEAYSSENHFLGIAGFFCDREENELVPEVCCYLRQEYQGKGLGFNIFSALIDYAFQTVSNDRIVSEVFEDNVPSKTIMEKLRFVERTPRRNNIGQIRYELTRQDRGLSLLSDLIMKDPIKFKPNVKDLEKENMERVRELWFSYFNKGVPLCTGGSDRSFINWSDLKDSPNLISFEQYRSDRSSTTYVFSGRIKNFLQQEEILRGADIISGLDASFTLGAHEGITRLGRCIYDSENNNGIFFAKGGYGFTVCSLATMKPIAYQTHFVEVDKTQGDKLIVEDLERVVQVHAKAKTLFLELKTIAGAIYTTEELAKIITLCKKNSLFLVADLAHINMEFNASSSFPDVAELCHAQGYYNFAMVYTGSKIYGLERARVGFMVLSKKNPIKDFHQTYVKDLWRVLGSAGDLSFEVAHALFNKPLEERVTYKRDSAHRYRYNMNLMLAYIEGVDSPTLDQDLIDQVKTEIPHEYSSGITGIKVFYKPVGGMHLKIDMSELRNMYYSNIRMFNSEIFSYLLNKIYAIVTLHSYQIMDPHGFSMRLSFGVKDDVHQGMKSIAKLVKSLSSDLSYNRFLPNVRSVEELIFPSS